MDVWSSCQPGSHMTRRFLRACLSTILIVLGLIAGCSSKSTGGGRPFEGQKLHVFIWSNYFDPKLEKEFEEQTGADVLFDNYDSDEELEAKLATGASYDLVFPSDRSVPGL